MNGARVVLVVAMALLVGLVASFVWASLGGNLLAGLRHVASDRWGVVTLADLGIGLLFVLAWIAVLERSVVKVVCWGVALGLTGNFATLVYVGWRALRHRTLRGVFLGDEPGPG